MDKLLKRSFITPDDIIRIIDSGGALVNLLSNTSSPNCPLIGSKIKIINKLGEGVEGTVYEITTAQGMNSRFAMKETKDKSRMITVRFTPKNTYYNQANAVVKGYKLPTTPEFYLSLNRIPGIAYTKRPKRNIELSFPTFEDIAPCKIEKKVRFSFGVDINPPVLPGDYICLESTVEASINAFVSNLIERTLCPHFVQFISFASCGKTTAFTFMEKIDVDLYSVVDKFTPHQVTTLNFQVFMALAQLQENFEIAHQDLHLKNVFLMNSKHYTWRNIVTSNVDLWRYRIEGQNYFIDSPKFLVKLGDWGFSGKYSHPRLLRKDLMNGRFIDWNCPMNFSHVYDMLFYLTSLVQKLDGSPSAYNAWKCINFIVNGRADSSLTDAEKKRYNSFIQNTEWIDSEGKSMMPTMRPILIKIRNRKWPTPREVLKACFERFTQSPPSEKTYLDISELV